MHQILYSTNTWLAYIITEKFYSGSHYIWCTPNFHMNNQTKIDATTPPTSTPYDILTSLNGEVSRGDKHSAKIKENKLGLIRGAAIKKGQGIITADQESEVIEIVNNSEIRDFRPLLYVMSYEAVRGLLRTVPVKDRAHPLSIEFIIEELPRNLFDVIEL
jgi:hypothetical protein